MTRVITASDHSYPERRKRRRSVTTFARPDLAKASGAGGGLSSLPGLETPQAKLERAMQKAVEEGFKQGTDAAIQEARDRIGEAHQVLESAAAAMGQAREQFLKALEPQLLELVKSAAERVIRRETDTDEGLIVRTLRAAVELLIEREEVVVRVNPRDAAALESMGVSIPELFRGFPHVEVIPDERVGRGGCLIETKSLVLDATLQTQLDRVLDAITEPDHGDA